MPSPNPARGRTRHKDRSRDRDSHRELHAQPPAALPPPIIHPHLSPKVSHCMRLAPMCQMRHSKSLIKQTVSSDETMPQAAPTIQAHRGPAEPGTEAGIGTATRNHTHGQPHRQAASRTNHALPSNWPEKFPTCSCRIAQNNPKVGKKRPKCDSRGTNVTLGAH